ncbi:serine hydrolase domain-containing protein [Roseiterribacter gracilis]|uniref:Serine hydrolase n=1 Tax=Roseiterribacter gracilis TaxID=2812848 RepID=A0A8S8XHW3_9PROT|nr:serine hydrolase [Rhodospirillales bacterium TMPK1]
MNRFLVAVAVAAPLVWHAPSFAADAASISAAIDKAAAAAVAAGESAGLQVAVYKDGKPLLVKGYGVGSLELKTPVTNDSVFRIGSVTKQFTAVALLLLQEEGKLSLDDKLSKYYPDFPRAADITLKQMLNHTSGISNYTDDPSFAKDGMIKRTSDEMVTFIAKLPKTSDFDPGTGWRYSNSAYFILGGVVEKAAGKPLADVLKTRLFVPLGMTHTALDDEAEVVAGRVAGYSATAPGKFANAAYLSMTIPGGAGSMRSSATDLAKWNAALFGGKILKPASFEAMTSPGKLNNGENSSAAMKRPDAAKDAPPPRKREYGYALQMSDEEGHEKINHGGGIFGFSSMLTEFPKDHVTVVVLANTIGKDVGTAKIVPKIERLALGLPAEKKQTAEVK